METLTPDLEQKIRSGTSPSASGSSCYFVALTPTMGLKLYGTKLERDASYVALSVAAEHGVAPKVGQCVDIENLTIHPKKRPVWWPASFHPRTMFGFMTEIATPGDCDSEECREIEGQLYRIFGLRIADIGYSNVGRLPDGTAVALDIDGRFSGLLNDTEIDSITEEWGGGYW